MTTAAISRYKDTVAAAAAALDTGGCVIVPTETVYGLAADATNDRAVARIFELKGRPKLNPLICHVSGLAMAQRFGLFDAASERLARAFWPGPLTLVVPLKPRSGISELAVAGLETIALRCPTGPVRDLTATLNRPLAAPSANRSGHVSPTQASHAEAEFPDGKVIIIDGGRCEIGIESTIARVKGDHIEILRPGAISAEQLSGIAKLSARAYEGDEIAAPGMLSSHYAPNASVQLDVTTCPQGAALLAFGDGVGKARGAAAAIRNLSENGDLGEAAANLYRDIKSLDGSGCDHIAVEPIPARDLGIAINDRLRRAAAPRMPK